MHSTQSTEKVSTGHLAESLVTIAENAPEGESAEAWTTLCLALASQLGRRGKAYKNELGLPGKASEIAWEEPSSVPAVLSFSISYSRSGGEITGRKRTDVRVSELVLTARDRCDKLGLGYIEAGGAAAEVLGTCSGTAAEKKLKRELEKESGGESKAPSSSRRSGASAGTRSNRGTTRGPHPSSGPATASCSSSYPAPNGCDTQDAEQADNRRSERSDRKNSGGSKRSIPPFRHCANTEQFKARGTRSQREYLDARARMQAERLLFLYLLSCALQASYQEGEDEGWITVEAEKMEEEMGAPYHSTWKVWLDSDLIVAWKDGKYIPPYETEDGKGKARMFRIPDEVLNEWLSRAGDESRRWWLHTPEPERTTEPATMTCDLSDDSNNRPPELVYKALKYWEGTTQPFDLDALDEALASLSERDWKAARAQHASLQLAQQTILQQADGEEGQVQLQNAYRATFAGRIVFKKGGPQGLMSAVKEMAYAQAYGYRNYDIKSCHTSGLKQIADQLAELGVEIDVSPWEEYDGKYAVADRTGLPVILVKIVEHAIKYGAYLPSSIAQAEKVFEDSPVDAEELALIKAAKKYAEGPDEALGKLYQEFGEMRKVVVEISDALLEDYYNAHQSGGYMHNACGVSFAPHNYDSAHKQRTQVMAWMLQGLEAAFIHAITILSEDYDYEPLHNDHDGLGVRGEIPDEAQDRARDRSGFHRAELVEKAHADADDIETVYGPEAAREKPEGKAHEGTESGAEASEEELVRRHLERKREKKRRRHRGPPDEVVAKHSPDPSERVELSREEAEDEDQDGTCSAQSGTQDAVEAYLEKRRRVAEGQVPDDPHEAIEEGFSMQEWKAAQKHSMKTM